MDAGGELRGSNVTTHASTLASVFSFVALWAAARRAARGERYHASVARFRIEQEGRLLALRDATSW